MIPEHYHGREQAFIKHELLRAYLERLFMIIGKHEKTISYVDCFAGPWQEDTEDLEDTSIAISLRITKKYNKSISGDLIGDIRSIIKTVRHNVAVTVTPD